MKNDEIIQIIFSSKALTPALAEKAMVELFSFGAADVYFPSVFLGNTVLCVLCKEKPREAILTYLSGLDAAAHIYESIMHRSVLDRSFEKIETQYGAVTNKISQGYGIYRSKLEYDELAAIAKQEKVSIPYLKSQIKKNIQS